MTFDRASLLLNMLLILVSVGAHQAGAEEFAFFLVTLIVCVIVWRREEEGRPLLLSDTLGTVICLGAFIALMWRGVSAAAAGGYRMTDIGVAPVGDFLIIFQWVTLCRERKGHDYFWMYLVTLIHMGTAGLQMPGLAYGFFFIVYAFLAICALAMCHAAMKARAAGVSRSGLRPAGADSAPTQVRAPATEPAAAQPRVNGGFFLSGLAATPPVLFAVALLFIVLPRTAATGTIAPAILRLGRQPTSGFSSTVRLGAVGQIQDNPTVVMHVIVRDPETHASVQVPSLLLRGVPLDTYLRDGDVWSWQLSPSRGARWWWPTPLSFRGPRFDRIYPDSFPGYFEAPYREITCDIAIEPLDTPILFAPFAPESVFSTRRFPVGINTRTYVLQSSMTYRRTPLNYTVISRLFDAAPPPNPPTVTLSDELLRPYLTLPSDLSPRIRALAQQIAPASLRTDYEKAERILNFLADSDRFSYTIEMQPTAGVEPVEDFLFNLKRGHCEYFASSMVVLLREVNVPARLVNGFKVSEWNPLAGAYVVRQQHAHSWVEAYLRPYGWRTLDPTAVSREAATPKPTLARRIGRNVYDWTDSLWVSYVLNFDSNSQVVPYAWLRRITDRIVSWIPDPFAPGVTGPIPRSYESPEVRTGPIYGILTRLLWIAAALFGVALAWLTVRGLLQRKRGRQAPLRQFRFYARMERLLRRRGFRRPDAQTPWEFSAALAESHWPAAAQVAAITDRFCRARYGARPPTVADLYEIEQALRVIRRTRRARAPSIIMSRFGRNGNEEQTMSDLKAGFSPREWESIRQNYTAWWRGELDRPLVSASVADDEAWFSSFLPNWPQDMSDDELVAFVEKTFSRRRFYGDAYPHFFVNYGPGTAAAFAGAGLHAAPDTVWFTPVAHSRLADIRIALDRENLWWRRVRHVTDSSPGAWATEFRSASPTSAAISTSWPRFAGPMSCSWTWSNSPPRCSAAAGRSRACGWKSSTSSTRSSSRTAPAASPWGPTWAPGPTYMLQSDFSYMISPNMFREFVLPDLKACCDHLEYAFYHLDGVGELPHLDDMLAIPNLHGIQWLAGRGQTSRGRMARGAGSDSVGRKAGLGGRHAGGRPEDRPAPWRKGILPQPDRRRHHRRFRSSAREGTRRRLRRRVPFKSGHNIIISLYGANSLIKSRSCPESAASFCRDARIT